MTTIINLKKRFFDSLKRGTGEAILIARENPTIDFSAYIMKGALKNYAYDGQCEGSRAQYIIDLILLSNKRMKIRKVILKGLATEQKDTWSLTHLFELAKFFAQQGDEEAKQAIYDRFLNHPIDHSDWVGYEEILELDGIQGLFYIAEKFGKVIEKNPDDWQDKSIVTYFQDKNPKINVAEEIENIAQTNKYVRIYLDNIKRTEENWKKHKSEPQQFKDVLDEILNSKPFLPYRRTKELNESELKIIAKELVVEQEINKREKLLKVFTSHKFPLNSEFILKLAQEKVSNKNRISEFAIDALKFLRSDAIREFALNKIYKSTKPEVFVEILVSNYKQGDGKLLTELASKTKNEHKIESLAGGYVSIFNVNKTEECKKPLEALYNKMNCGIHRNSIIEVLIDNKVLSARLKKEIKCDSYFATRELLK